VTVVYRASVPIYETECDECHSVIRYQKAEARPNQGYIYCPVCGVPIRALTVNSVTVLDEKEQKNGDKIRAMSDEELAEFLTTIEVKCYKRLGYESETERFKAQWLDWLKKEAEI